MTHAARPFLWSLLVLAPVGGCRTEAAAPPPAAAPAPAPAAPSNRIALPANVRDNLGVTFARAERRAVQRTLRVAGRITLPPEATRTVRATMAGPVTVLVGPMERVAVGTPLAVLRSPEIRTAQDALHRARHDADEAVDLAKVAEARRQEADRAASALLKRIRALDALSVRRADLEAELDTVRRRGDVAAAEVVAARSRTERERHHFTVQLQAFAERVGLTPAELRAPVEGAGVDGERAERWELVSELTVLADRAGVVARLHVVGGGWAAEGDPLIEVVDDAAWRFEGDILESDIARLLAARGGDPLDAPLEARLVPAWPTDLVPPPATPASLRLGLLGDATRRTHPIFGAAEGPRPAWALPGTGAFAELVLAGDDLPEVAVPRAAVVRDGVTSRVYVRDPADPDQVIETDVDLGPDDGRWVAVLSGVVPGAEVVLSGAYELSLSRASAPAAKGHFHADGSFHPEGDDDDHGSEGEEH